jgi:hypothetical protein
MNQENGSKDVRISINPELDQAFMAAIKSRIGLSRSIIFGRLLQVGLPAIEVIIGSGWANARIVPGHEEGSLGRSIALDEAALLCVKYGLYVPDVEDVIDNVGDEVLGTSNAFDNMKKEGKEKGIEDIFEEGSSEIDEVLKQEIIKALVKRISIAQQTKVQFNKEEE